jgi:hypothetical protein
LESTLGPIWAPAAVAVVDFALAGIVWALAARAKPDPGIDLAGLVNNPMEAAAQRLLIPAALSLLKGLRAKKEPAT